MTVADTDVLIDFLAGVEPANRRVSQEIARDSLRTTAITRFELLSGARTAKQEEIVRTLLDLLPTLPLDEPSADRASEVRSSLDRAGQGIGMADSLIAGIVIQHGAELLTRNRKHFERVPALRLADLR
jgi:tRNA(fMet)-specific endonuclease VapC